MIRKAVSADIMNVMKIIEETIVEMHSYGNTQWDEHYPQEKDFLHDMQRGDLYLSEREEKIVGFACINTIESAEYNSLPWSLQETAMILHRMAVAPARRRSGVGLELMNFAEERALENNMRYLKTDTYSINIKMNALFVKCGYQRIGEMKFPSKEKPFYCYEKVLRRVR
ncbi:GNAT family N-acetyltransferase [Azotosporobacter soli]|uniref:GNAT family N-acetyltransferase n=1 Tax=Azotosporobacter soli TaxID=3055040 RepID=UPI0031FEB84E